MLANRSEREIQAMMLAPPRCASHWPRTTVLVVGVGSITLATSSALASEPAKTIVTTPLGTMREPSSDEAWWTGPMLANTPATPPRGHVTGETFLFVEVKRDSRLHGSLILISYGVTDRLALGLKPMFGLNRVGTKSSQPGIGDLTVLAQYRLTSPTASARKPTIALVLQRSLPLGRYDQLDTRPTTGLGKGAQSTTVSLYAQQSFRLINGHLFRARLNLSRTFAGRADIDGASVYGTTAGFRGRALPGDSAVIVVAGEYSVTRRWALALDVVYERTGFGSISGLYEPGDTVAPGAVQLRIDRSEAFALAPAIEYSLNGNLGVLLGTRFKFRGHNSAPSVTPALAITFALRP